MANDALMITVSYSGREKQIPLVVRPTLELSDFQVDQAELELCGIVRHVFQVPAEAGFSLHEAETSRTLTKESFRDPSYIQAFPKHWYLAVEKSAAEAGEEEEEREGGKYDMNSAFDLYAEGFSDLDETLPSLTELSLADAKYQSISLSAGPTGHFEVTLRYFSIQPVSAPPRVDSPTDPPLFGADSQSSQQSSESLDVLSTTFVHRVEGAGQEAGLHQGDTVHMINGASIIRSSFTEIQDLLAQCGSELTLMVLPKEHDDLQFLYPQYTGGSVGEYTSGDEKVIARDIPVVVGNGTSLPGDHMRQGKGGQGEQPIGLYQFNGSASSLDHTHSNSSSEQLHPAGEDPLINGSIHDIPISSPSKTWTSGNRSGTGSNSQLDRLDENKPYIAAPWKGALYNGDIGYEYQHMCPAVDPSWYQDPQDVEVEGGTSPSSEPGQDVIPHKNRVGRSHSQDSAVTRRISLQSTGGEEESHSQPTWAEGHSADLGVVKIKKHNKKSLEMLTSLSTAPPPRGMRRIHSDNVIGQNHRGRNVGPEFEPNSRLHSLEQNTDINTTPTTKVPPPESFKPGMPISSTTKPSSGGRVRKAATRSYSSQRQQLHSRSRIGDSEATARRAESLRKNLSQPTVEERREGERSPSESGVTHTETVSSGSVKEEEVLSDQQVATPTIHIASVEVAPQEGFRGRREVRGGSHTLRHQDSSPPMSPHTYQTTTLDPRIHRPPAGGELRVRPSTKDFLTKSVEVPLLTESSSRRLPIVKTRSAQTQFGTEVVNELNIDEAVAASQGGTAALSVQFPSRSFSMDTGGSSVGGVGDPGTRGWGVGMFPPSSRRFSFEERSTNRNVPCHGLLGKKQVSDGHSRRGSTRSWKTFYTVLAGSHMVFYRDKKDADANKPCEEPPLEVVPGRADLTHGYTKRKFVFRVTLADGSEYLLQCEDSQSMLHWVTAIYKLNGGKMVEQQRPRLDSARLLSPASPLASRRGTSPGPSSAGRAGRKKGIVRNLKDAWSRKKTSSAHSEPAFGQLLADCPMSSENKCVPLVVEFCVHEVEEHGLEVEGIYRKPGQGSVIKNMVMEIDKGQFEFEEYGDIHTIGSLLKKFFLELPDTLIPGDRYKEFLGVVMETPGEMEQVTLLRGLVFHLPMAHYHTLRYLIRHLNRVVDHAEQNKMVLRNVAMVFGPTLMLRSDPTEEFNLVAMNTTFTVVEMLCKHWRSIFDSETCHEEQQLERERERERQREERMDGEGGGGGLVSAQRTSSDPAVNSLKVKKDNLFNASPKMVRRIKNQLSSKKAAERNSYSGGEAQLSAAFSRKQHNRSDTLPPAFANNPTAALLSPSHPSPARSWSRAGSSGALQNVRRRDGDSGYGGDLNPHSRYACREQWGGREEGRRELAGSIWAKGKERQRGHGSAKDRERERVVKREHSGQSRSQILSSHPPPPPIAHQRELLTSYQHPPQPSHHHTHSTPSHDLLHRSTTLPPSPEHHNSLPTHHLPPSSLHGPSSPGMRRKISYNMAVNVGYRHQPSMGAYGYKNIRRQQSSEQLPFPDDYREREFSHSYTPQSSIRSTTHSTAGKFGQTHSSQQSGSNSRRHHPRERGDSSEVTTQSRVLSLI